MSIIDQECDHTQVAVHNAYSLRDTPTSEIARYCCIKCIEQSMHYIDSISDIEIRTNAKRFVIECISYGPRMDTHIFTNDVKFQVISYFLERGFPTCCQIFEFVFPYTCEQLEILASYGAFPIKDDLYCYISSDLYDEIKTIYRCISDDDEDNQQTKAILYDFIYSREMPLTVYEALGTIYVDDCIRLVTKYIL